jgi:transketolase
VKAAELLQGDGVSASVLNVHTLQPLDEEAVLEAATRRRAVITVEDHSARGGLGGAVAEVLASRNGSLAPLRIIGMRTFGESGSPAELYEKYGLTGDGIAGTVRDALKDVS